MKKGIILFLMIFLAGFMTVSAQDFNITFTVDMSVQIAKGSFDPATDDVRCVGTVYVDHAWSPPDTPVMTDNGDETYSVTYAMPAGTYGYKYVIGDAWGRDESQDRPITVNADAVLDPVFFNDETIGGDATVTFNVDMTVVAEDNLAPFDPTANTVWVAGSFTDWQNGCVDFPMVDDNDDLIYSITVPGFTGGDQLAFKFTYGTTADPSDGSITWESISDRTLFVLDGEQTFTDYWNSEEPVTETVQGSILFSVDMSVMSEIGIFDPANDGVWVRGSFNNWGDGTAIDDYPEIIIMDQDIFNPNLFSLLIPLDEELGLEMYYKYFADINTDLTDPDWTETYERPYSSGGGNRVIAYEGVDNQAAPVSYFEDVNPEWVIPAGTTVEIEFNVDMTPAMDPALQAQPFDPTTDQLYWRYEQGSASFSQGVVWDDRGQYMELTDPDADNIYSGTVTVVGPSFNGFEYIYEYYSAALDQIVGEPTGYGWAYRVRFIGQSGGANAFDQPYSAPTDTWTNAEDKSGDWEAAPAGWVSDVDDYNNLPTSFSLEQNYPNPFNPTTTIRFTVPESGMVSLKVYNLLGQEVATLMNKELSVGSYDIHFNAANFSSGVYFYTVKVNNFTATKKMMLIK